MKTEELLHRIVENIQNMNQLNKSYFIAEADRIIAEWIANNKKSFPISEDTHFAVGVLSISFGLPPLFVESLHQMKNKNRLLSHLQNYPKPEQTAFLSSLTATASS